MARTLPFRIVHAADNKTASVRKADRAVPLLVIDHFEIQVHRIVVQQLFELRGHYIVGGQVILVLVIPIERDFAGRRPTSYRNVYTLRSWQRR
jgi:hypothetical protein